jgi:8-oxo-dGTP pyrophosphatase MutT (NUDIX family)
MPQRENGFQRHVRACNNAALPGRRLPFFLGAVQVGWVLSEHTGPLATFGVRRDGSGMVLDDPLALPALGRSLSEAGLCPWRNEAFDVRATPDGPVLAQIDRGALPVLGILAVGVHLNGLVRRADGLHLWLARRAANRPLDPGKLDQMVGGGVPAGYDPAQTLAKESEEEAALPPALVAQAVHRGVIHYAMERAEGLRRDMLHCYDVMLPESFTPSPVDGEVDGFELWPIARVVDTVRHTDDFKFNVNLVLIDLFVRLGLIPQGA